MGFTYPPVIGDSPLYNPRFYPSIGADGMLSYEFAQTLYLSKNDFRLSYLSGVIPGAATSGSAIVLDSFLGISGLGALSCSSLLVGGVAVGSSPFLSGVTAGTALADKALVLDASKNISGINSLSATTLAGTVSTVAQPNITSLGTLSALTIDGNLVFSGASRSVSGLSSITATSIGGTLSTAAQTSITSIGTLTGLTIDGNLVFSGASRTLTGLSSITATSIGGTLSTAAQTSITSIGTLTGLTIAGNLVFSGSSRTITGLSSITATTLAGTLSTASQPNITSIGSLGSLTVSSSSADALSLVNSSGSTSASLSFNSGTYYSSLGLRSNSDVLGESNNFVLRHNSVDSISVSPGGSIGLGGYSPSPTYAIRCGSLSCDSIAIGTTNYDLTPLGATAGTASASKALIVDSSRNISNINSLASTSITGTLQTAAQPNITSIQSLKMASAQMMFNTTTQYTNGTYGSAPITLNGGNIYIKTSNTLNDGSSAWDMAMYLESSNATPVSFAFQLNTGTGATSTNAAVLGTVSNSDLMLMTNNSSKVTLTAAGRLGVATTTPSAMLHVASSVSTSVAIAAPYANATSTSYSTSSGTVNDSVGIRCDNALSVGTRGVYISSDRRVKQDIRSIELDRAMAFIDQIDPKIYALKAEPSRMQLGYLAQSVFDYDRGLVGLIPNEEMIDDDKDGFTPAGIQLTVSYERVIPLLHVALREALRQIDELRQRFSKQ